MLRKDLRILRRSPILLGLLVSYPVIIALLVGLVAGYANTKPRVGLVDEDNLPPIVEIAGQKFGVSKTIAEVAHNVKLVRMSKDDAEGQLRSGKIVGVITVPAGFIADLQTAVRSPSLIVETGTGGVTPRVQQQMQALVYQLNRKLQRAFIAANLRYVTLILNGGDGSFLGRGIHVLGLEGTQKLLASLPPSQRVARIQKFVRVARLALGQTGNALQATANPIRLEQRTSTGRTWVLSAQVQAYGIALTITFLALLLAAGSSAAERDENVIGRLGRGLLSHGQLVAAKVALASAVALALGGAIALVFGIVIEAGGVVGGEPWERFPLLLAGIALAGAAVGAIGTLIGALAREARTASLIAVLVVLPVVFLGLVPREVVAAAGWISDALPFVHAVRYFGSALYDPSPWATLGRETVWLVGLCAVFSGLARLGVRRLAG
ncbi:MAG: ABC transporter permease [Actinobacteria bacterium]|nr:MAG: ABC transporter permease [Actinomycetota bacterium]